MTADMQLVLCSNNKNKTIVNNGDIRVAAFYLFFQPNLTLNAISDKTLSFSTIASNLRLFGQIIYFDENLKIK